MEPQHKRAPADRSRLLPEYRALLEEQEALGGPAMETLSPQQARADSEIRLALHWGAKDEVARIENLEIPNGDIGLKARLYRVAGTRRTILFFHGGGWMVGSIETHDGPVRTLANAARANVLSVEYRKAPEAPFPAALEDAEAALLWLQANGGVLGLDADRLILAGDSAGASIVASLAIRARDLAVPLAGQVLIYPATDLAGASASRAEFSSGFSLHQSTMVWFAENYLCGGTPPSDPRVSPLLAPDLSRLAPALLVTADHDPLRDEGRSYAQRLIAAGNDVCYEEWQGTIHGFFIMDRAGRTARKLIGRIGEWAESLWNRHDGAERGGD
jgi:acetyl esterase